METKQETILERIANLRADYTRLALKCKAHSLRVDPRTVDSYIERIKALEAQL
jgi:hypothetical protein